MSLPSKNRHMEEASPARNSEESPAQAKGFPFLKLPGEIRNMVYEYALVDTEHTVRLNKLIFDDKVRRMYCHSPRTPDRDDLPSQTKGSIMRTRRQYKWCNEGRHAQLAVQLLQTCKQINAEAAAVFYGKNLFSFRGDEQLALFLKLVERRLPLLRRVALAIDQPTKGSRDDSGCLFDVDLELLFYRLRGVVNLEFLYLNPAFLQHLGSTPDKAASTFHKMAKEWMDAVGASKSDPLAVLQVIKLPPARTDLRSTRQWTQLGTGQVQFQQSLEEHLQGK